MSRSLDWYLALPCFEQFNDFVSDRHYHAVPPDWSVIVTDIIGSTQAISEGRYRDVNTIGAACIAAAQNAMDRREFPYVFGGDGASLVVPNEMLAQVRAAVGRVAQLARDSFQLQLRIGVVDVETLAREGNQLEVAKLRLAGKQNIAMFRGGALARAEAIVKGHSRGVAAPEGLAPNSASSSQGHLDGLSCRWQPIPSLNGRIATLVAVACGESHSATYAALLSRVEAVLNDDSRSAVPVHAVNMSYRDVPGLMRDEARYHRHWFNWRFLHRMVEIVAAVLVFKWGVKPLLFNPTTYATSLGRHTDFRKFDDTLRMVLDLTVDQIAALRAMLESMRIAGAIRYGLHESSAALMTCYVHGLDEGEHIHFVDGGDGGYAMAAKQMKSQAVATPAE